MQKSRKQFFILSILIVLIMSATAITKSQGFSDAFSSEDECNDWSCESDDSSQNFVSKVSSTIPVVDADWQDQSIVSDCALGWGSDVWELTLTESKTVNIEVEDCCCVGDYYDIYVGDEKIGTTPKPSAWGCQEESQDLSVGDFDTVLLPGTYEIKIRNASFLEHTAKEIAHAFMCPAGYTVTGTLSEPPKQPDVTFADSIEFLNDQSPYQAGRFELEATVKNAGDADADDIVVRFFAGNPDEGGVQIGDDQAIDSLAMGEEESVSVEWLLDGNVEDLDIVAKAYLASGTDRDLKNNTIEQTVDVYYVAFAHNVDAYNFNNWPIERQDIINNLLLYIDVFHPEDMIKTWKFGVIYPVFALATEAAGHCYGMSSTSALYLKYPEIKPVDKTTFAMDIEEVRGEIQYYHRRQFDHVMEAIMMKTFGFNAEKEYGNLIQAIKESNELAILLMYSEGEEGGHAVSAYQILNLGEEKRVYVYDNNLNLDRMDMVGSSIYATFNIENNQFSYNPSGIYGADFDLVIARRANLTWSDQGEVILERFYNWVLEQIAKAGKIRIFVGSPVDPLVTDQFGRKIGYENGVFVNEIPSAEFQALGDKEVFDLPSDLAYTFSAEGTGSGTMMLQILLPIADDTVRGVGYIDVPVQEGSQSTIQFALDNEDWILSVDGEPREPDLVEDFQIVKNYLPILANNFDPSLGCGQKVVNPGFENGAEVGWDSASDWGRDLFYTSDELPNSVSPNNGQQAVWLGGRNDEIATLSQTITPPEDAQTATLTYWYWSDSEETLCNNDHAWAEINRGVLKIHSLCEDTNTTGWVKETFDLTPYLGAPMTIGFTVDTNGSALSNFYIDDVNVQIDCKE